MQCFARSYHGFFLIKSIVIVALKSIRYALLGYLNRFRNYKKIYICSGLMVISRNNDMPIFVSDAGFSVNHGAILLWMLDALYQAKIKELVHDMAYYKNAVNLHHDFSAKCVQQNEEDVKTIIDIINKNFISLFEEQ